MIKILKIIQMSTCALFDQFRFFLPLFLKLIYANYLAVNKELARKKEVGGVSWLKCIYAFIEVIYDLFSIPV